MPPAIAPIVTESPLTVLDPTNTLVALVTLSISLVLVSNLIPHQGPPSIPGPLTIPGLPLSQTTYAQWALSQRASGLLDAPRFLGAEVIRDSKARESQKELLIT
jgi:hypothetical protein